MNYLQDNISPFNCFLYLRKYHAILSLYVIILNYYLTILNVSLAIKINLNINSEFVKMSKLWDKKLQLPFLFFISGFHKNILVKKKLMGEIIIWHFWEGIKRSENFISGANIYFMSSLMSWVISFKIQSLEKTQGKKCRSILHRNR